METGPVETVLARPAHPYTLGLINSVPQAQRTRASIWPRFPARRPIRSHLPPGCRFAPRCVLASPDCTREQPELARTCRGSRDRLHPSPCRGAGRAELRVMMADALLRADDLVRSFPVRGIAWRGKRADGARTEWRHAVGRPRRDTGRRRRVRLRQEHAGAGLGATDRARFRADPLCRRRCARAARRCAAALQSPRPTGLSGPLRLAQPAHDRGRDAGGGAARAPDRAAIRPNGADRRTAVAGAAAGRRHATASARVLRRAAPAHRHRARPVGPARVC